MPGRKASEQERREAILRAAFAVASRDRLQGITARAVATEAGVSPGLIFFYFESLDRLLVELLDWLFAGSITPAELLYRAGVAGAPGEKMVALIRRDVERLLAHRDRVELFFDYWVLGTRHPVIRRRMRWALDRYRASFEPIARAVVECDPARYAGITPPGLAAVASSFVEGCAIQITMDPAQFDLERSMATLAALVLHPTAPVPHASGAAAPRIPLPA